MKTSILIVTHKKDFRYLVYCIRSINKFARGWEDVTILFPETDWSEFTTMIGPEIMGQDTIKYRPIGSPEWEGKGMLWHEWQVTCADHWCPNVDFIAHFDSDCIFTGPVSPEAFIKEGKPILRYELFESIGRRHPGVLRWKEAAESCLPFPVPWECMRGHPEVYHIGLYARTRELMEMKLGESPEKWVFRQQNTFPQTYAEYPTLGAVAMQTFTDKYIPFDQSKEPNPDRAETPVIQFWSHGDPDKDQPIWIWGEQKHIIPLNVCADYGLLEPVLK